MTNSPLIFLPWMRTGLAALKQEVPASSSPDQTRLQVKIPVRLAAGAQGNSQTIRSNEDKVLTLKGPGDVLGFNPAAVARTEPVNGDTSFEPNYFPFVEFLEPDFPWRYSLSNLGNSGIQEDKIMPWITLIVLKEDEFSWITDQPGAKLPVITVEKAANLPNLEETWAWTHVQVAKGNEQAIPLDEYISQFPELTCSRLICPRRLEELTRYTAFIVPTYEMGRLAGLEAGFTPNSKFSWGAESAQVKLPVYYSFTFQTSEKGDFEELLDRIQFSPTALDMGSRLVDASQPGLFTTSSEGKVVERTFVHTSESGMVEKEAIWMEGALVPPGYAEHSRKKFEVTDLTKSIHQELTVQLESDPLGTTDMEEDPLVTIPVYGRYYKQTNSIQLPDADGQWPTNDRWLEELNLDLRGRISSASGTVVVQEHQEEYMEECWQQAGEIREANRLLHLAGSTYEANKSMMDKHLDPLDDARFMMISQPFHHYYVHNNGKNERSFKERYKVSGLPSGVLSYPFRRILGTKSQFNGIHQLFDLWYEKPKDDNDPDTDTQWLKELIETFFDKGELQELKFPGIRPDPVFIDPVDPKQLRASFDIKSDLLERLNETITVPWLPAIESFERIMMTPRIDTAMYRYLIEKSLDHLSPGLGQLPVNSILLMEENRKFIESYMVGLNHEMSRELLWREFPTDQRGTIFRYFWDSVQGKNPEPDIKNIHQWSNELGGNTIKNSEASSNNLTLVLKADLVRRYPGTHLFAIKTTSNTSPQQWENIFKKMDQGQSGTDFQVIKPLFSGSLSSDMILYGFPFTNAEVQAGGYYFVFAGKPSLPRFGLDQTASDGISSWDDLSWEDLVHQQTEPAFVRVAENSLSTRAKSINVQSNIKWGANSAAMAHITYQKPVRIVVPANHLLRNTIIS